MKSGVRRGAWWLLAGTLALGLMAACGGAAEPAATPTPATSPTAVAATPTPATGPTVVATTPTPARAQPQYGGEYRFEVASPRIGQDPVVTTGTGYFSNYGRALSSLLRYEMAEDIPVEAFVVAPDLAERWENPDPTTYIFHLRKGVKWQNIPPVNGREFTADDAVFSIRRLAGDGSAQRGYWADLASVEATDRYTVKVTLSGTSADFLMLVAQGWNKMMAPEAVEAGGGHLRNGPTIGTGAWYITCEVDVQCVFKRNPEHHVTDAQGNRLPYLDGMRNLIMEDVQARFAALRAKQLDADPLIAQQVQIVEKSYPQIVIDSSRGYSAQMLHFRNDKAPWSDERVRMAVSKSIDRQDIIDTMLGGYGHFASLSMIMPSPDSYLPYEELQAAYKRDIPLARQLLADAGYAGGITGAQLWVANYRPEFIGVAELMQQQLKEAGISVELFIHDRPTYLSRVYIRHGDYPDLAYGPQGTFFADAWLMAYYRSDGGRNTSYVNDPELDKMIGDQHRELDPKRRDEILNQINRYLLKKNYQLVLYQYVSQSAAWPWLKNRVRSAGGDYPAGRGVEYYWIDKALYAQYR